MVTHDGVILTNSTVSKNSSNLGAGIYGGQILQATSDAIVDNTASGTNNAGGGLFLEAERRLPITSTCSQTPSRAMCPTPEPALPSRAAYQRQ
jgi:hypothetical protein